MFAKQEKPTFGKREVVGTFLLFFELCSAGCSFMLTSSDGGRGLEFSQLRIAYGSYQADGWCGKWL